MCVECGEEGESETYALELQGIGCGEIDFLGQVNVLGR